MTNFSGKWRLTKSENFDPFLKDLNVGMLKRQAAKMVSSEHHIEQAGDKMSVNVHVTGQSGKKQDYQVGGKYSEVEINGEEAEVSTKWEGAGIKEIHKTKTFEYTMVRELEDKETMILNLVSAKGAQAKRIYKLIK